jgi:3-hydroxyisobutyrate dehydrogenase-like beta-hydroxyacid dehydrogenase
MLAPSATICLVGFGEAGGILGTDLAQRGCALRSYDLLLDDPAQRERMLAKLAAAGVDPAFTLADALRGAKLVISAVTASSSQDVARAASPLLQAGQLFLDLNSVSPDTKRGNAELVEASGASYIEAAVMAPVPPQRLQVPLLLGGARAAELAPALTALGLNVTVVSPLIGVASAIKMCRSVMIKGLEALTVESLRTARHYGAEDAVLASLAASFPAMGWTAQQPDYLVSRVAQHGRRRAAELREVALTVAAAGIVPRMATAIAQAQDALVDEMLAAGVAYDPEGEFSWRSLADRLATTKDC